MKIKEQKSMSNLVCNIIYHKNCQKQEGSLVQIPYVNINAGSKNSDEILFWEMCFSDCYCKSILHYLFFAKIYWQRMQKIQRQAAGGT